MNSRLHFILHINTHWHGIEFRCFQKIIFSSETTKTHSDRVLPTVLDICNNNFLDRINDNKKNITFFLLTLKFYMLKSIIKINVITKKRINKKKKIDKWWLNVFVWGIKIVSVWVNKKRNVFLFSFLCEYSKSLIHKWYNNSQWLYHIIVEWKIWE